MAKKKATKTVALKTKESRPKSDAKPFSVTKAVKLNARDRVGQPKPERVLDDRPREARKAKKISVQELIDSQE
jgi:hypothetical protein